MDAFDAAATMTAECLCFRSRRVARLITRAYDEALRPLRLHATQLTLLNAIAMGGEGGNPMPRLADVLAMEISTLSRNLRPLERDGIIEIGRSPQDRRVRVASLTRKGRDLLRAALPLWREAHRRVTDTLGRQAADDLRRQLDAAATGIARIQ
jgi:DNA-binding MarR family transcriptional regulator